MTARVWDRFLTEADRAHLAVARPKVPYGFGEHVAVLSVGNCRDVAGDWPEPLLEAVKAWPNSTGPAAWDALDKIAVLLAAARAGGLPVIHVTGLAEEDSGIPGLSARCRPCKPSADPAAEDRHRRRYDIVEQAAPIPGEVVLRKTAPSAFFGTPLAAHLIANGIDTLIVVGAAVSGCVRATVVDGSSYRLRMLVVEECVYDRYEATRAISLFDIDQRYGDVISLDEILAWIKEHAPGSLIAATQATAADSASGHTHGHGHGEHSHGSHRHDELEALTSVEIPARVLARLPLDARPTSVIWHPVHSQTLRRSGGEIVAAVQDEMTKAFEGGLHVIVELAGAEPADPAELRSAIAQTSGGLLLIGVGYDPAPARAHAASPAAEPAPSPAQHSPRRARGVPVRAEECPECGGLSTAAERVTRSNGEATTLLVCAECGAAWEVDG